MNSLSMVAVLAAPDPSDPPCVIQWVGRRGLSVRAITYCARDVNVGTDGTYQVPGTMPICASCSVALARAGG